jgi:hypothetical protein
MSTDFEMNPEKAEVHPVQSDVSPERFEVDPVENEVVPPNHMSAR